MGFNYTFRADDVEGWDADTRDLVENRDRELELFFSAYEPTDNTSMVVSDTPPTTPAPQVGDQWFESDTGRTFVYYDNAWVEIGNATDIAGALQPGQITALTAVTTLTSDDVFPVVDNPAGAVATNKITATNLGSQLMQFAPQTSFRNKVINGNMSVWQRGLSVPINTLGYTADRWFHQSYNGATISRQPTSDTSVLPNVQYCAKVQRNSGVTITNFMYFTQSMETQESIKVSGKTITLSFYARKGANFSAALNAFKAELFYGTGTDQNVILGYTGQTQLFSNSFTLTSSWVRYSVTATIPVTSTEISPLFGYTPTGTAGANDYFEITGVQLEEGSVATPFEQRPIGTELALCQRYYYLLASGSSKALCTGFYTLTTLIVGYVPFPVTMRLPPALSVITGTDYYVSAYGFTNDTFNSFTIDNSNTTGAFIYNSTEVSSTVNTNAQLRTNNANAFIAFSAEL